MMMMMMTMMLMTIMMVILMIWFNGMRSSSNLALASNIGKSGVVINEGGAREADAVQVKDDV